MEKVEEFGDLSMVLGCQENHADLYLERRWLNSGRKREYAGLESQKC
jgi:hypothetical protein